MCRRFRRSSKKLEQTDLIETAEISKIREQYFVDDAEMAEILADRNLIKRIKQGSREARLHKGRYID